jgi:uroporphyrinogen III methyltransferase/synthase
MNSGFSPIKTDTLTVRVGTRGSPLALAQVDEVMALLKDGGGPARTTVEIFQSSGDLDKKSSLRGHAADDFFTDALDRALLEKRIDIAVHSAKDLPKAMLPDLEIYAITKSLDETDAFVGRTPFAALAPGARIGTSSELRHNALLALNPRLKPLSIRGTVQERLARFENGDFDGIIVATAALKRLGLTRYIKDIMPWDAFPLQGQLAVVGRRGDDDLRRLIAPLDARRGYGTVFLVGAGPGDPELITVKGVNILKQADAVFYDYLAHKGILKHAPGAEKIYVGKKRGDHSFAQPDISRMIRIRAQQGQRVVRLKGGDPLLFARGAEELRYLREFHVPGEVVPGVSSATGIAAELGIPLTARDVSSSVAFISAYTQDESRHGPEPVRVPKADTLVFFMGLSKLGAILRALTGQGYGAEVPVAVVSRGTFIDEKVVVGTIGTIERKVQNAGLSAPALIIAGRTVDYYRPRPPSAKTILYTGTNPEKYAALGRIIHLPMIRIQPKVFTPEETRNRLRDITSCDQIIFTSQFGVRYFFEFLRNNGFAAEGLRAKDFLVIGRHTARALEDHGFTPALISNIETSRGLLEKIRAERPVEGKTILFPRSNLPNPYLAQELTRLGARVEEWPVYENVKADKPPLPAGPIDAVFFTSPSTARNFLEFYGAIPAEWQVLSKGEVTALYLQERGYESEILANS